MADPAPLSFKTRGGGGGGGGGGAGGCRIQGPGPAAPPWPCPTPVAPYFFRPAPMVEDVICLHLLALLPPPQMHCTALQGSCVGVGHNTHERLQGQVDALEGGANLGSLRTLAHYHHVHSGDRGLDSTRLSGVRSGQRPVPRRTCVMLARIRGTPPPLAGVRRSKTSQSPPPSHCPRPARAHGPAGG